MGLVLKIALGVLLGLALFYGAATALTPDRATQCRAAGKMWIVVEASHGLPRHESCV